MDAGRFLFNLENEEKSKQFKPALKVKVQEFFKWYSNFQNKEPINLVAIDTSDMMCEHGCVITAKSKFSIVDILLSKSELLELLDQEANRWGIEIKIAEE